MATLTVERDPETGLALLPEGYIWRVVSTDRYLTLRLVSTWTQPLTRGMWWWKEEYIKTHEKEVMEDYYDTHNLASSVRTKGSVAYGLANLSDNMFRAWTKKQDQWELMRSFGGDYPPKNLNSV